MKRAALLALLVAGPMVGGLLASARAPQPPSAPPSDYVRGVGLGLFASDPQWDYGPMIEEIRSRGASDVLVVVNSFQSTRFAADIALRPGHSPDLETVERTLGQIRAAGMRAGLMPVVRLSQRHAGDWRGVITPADGLDAWFDAYRAFVRPLARLAERAGAVRFVVGSELNSMERYGERWRALIGELRQDYSGALSYSANWDRTHAVNFWDAVDEVGLTAYFPLRTGEAQPTRSSLARAWRQPRRQLAALSQRLGRPLLITEVGYSSQRRAAEHPWDDTTDAPIDLDLQRRLYEGFCDAFAQTPAVAGFYVWNWFGYGGPRDVGFTPRGKPAARTLASCFARDLEAPNGMEDGS